MRLLVVDDDLSVGNLMRAYLGPDLQTAVRELELKPVSKVDTQAVIRILDGLGGALA